MKKIVLISAAFALVFAGSAFAEYANPAAARRAAEILTTTRKYSQAIAAYEEGMALATDEKTRIDLACRRADVQVKAGKNADAVKGLRALTAEDRAARIQLLSKIAAIAKPVKTLADEANSAHAELAVLHAKDFEEAADPAAKQKSALALAACHEALGDAEKAAAAYHALRDLEGGTAATRFAALNAETAFLRRLGRLDEAIAVASNALALATSTPKFKEVRVAWDGLGEALFAAKNWEAAVEAFAQGAESAQPPRMVANNAWEAIKNLTGEKRFDVARALCARIRNVGGLKPDVFQKSYEFEARALNAEKRPADTLALFDKLLLDTNVMSKVNLVPFINMAAEQVRKLKYPTWDSTFEFYEKILAAPDKYGLSPERYKQVLAAYGNRAWKSFSHERMRKAVDLSAKTDKPFTPENAEVAKLLQEYDGLATFPMPEEKIKIPNDLDDFGVDPNRKVVHAKDFAPGWNPTNATECLQAAVDSDASTVIVDDMGSPWYIWNVVISKEKGSNKKILFKKGVVVLTAPEHKDKNRPGWYRNDMFSIKGATNLVVMGEGDPAKHDTYIGKYRSRKERFDYGFQYGGNGFNAHCTRALFKNLYIANCGQDALSWGGYDSFVVDCIFDDNFRQGMSLGGSRNCVYKNVTFCNTFGGEPHCGVDVEPYYEIYLCREHYFFDCHFYNNASKNFLFASSTYAPCTFYFKRCQFEASPNGNVGVLARPGIYLNAHAKAPSKIVFEDCRLDGYADGNVIQFLGTFLYDITFRNCVVNEKGLFRKNRKANKSPIHLNLDRAIWDGFYPYPGIVTFENFTINGYRDVPLISVADRNGKYGVNTFRGTINHNGKEVDVSTFSYLPPDRGLDECPEPDLAALHAPEGEPPAVYRRPFDFSFGHAYYHSRPHYSLLAAGRKGRKATFVIEARGDVKPEAELKVKTPTGETVSLGKAEKGENAYEYVFPADGVYLFDANFAGSAGFSVVSATGVDFAFQTESSGTGKVFSFSTGDNFPKYAGYFEVPGGKECCVKVQGGGFEIRDEDGEVVQRLEKTDYAGSKCVFFTPKQDAIWSIRCLETSANFKFFAPMPGILADDPAFLPTYGEDLPFKRIQKEYSSVPEIPTARLFPLPLKGAVAKAVDAAAAARAEFGNTNKWKKIYDTRRYHYDWSEPAAQTQEQLKVAALELEALEPVRKMRDMERYAARESADLRRYVAFVSLYAPVLALSDTEAKKYAASPVIPEDEDFRLKVNAVISPYGAEYIEEGFYYDDYAAVVKLAPFIVDRLDALKVNQ